MSTKGLDFIKFTIVIITMPASSPKSSLHYSRTGKFGKVNVEFCVKHPMFYGIVHICSLCTLGTQIHLISHNYCDYHCNHHHHFDHEYNQKWIWKGEHNVNYNLEIIAGNKFHYINIKRSISTIVIIIIIGKSKSVILPWRLCCWPSWAEIAPFLLIPT